MRVLPPACLARRSDLPRKLPSLCAAPWAKRAASAALSAGKSLLHQRGASDNCSLRSAALSLHQGCNNAKPPLPVVACPGRPRPARGLCAAAQGGRPRARAHRAAAARASRHGAPPGACDLLRLCQRRRRHCAQHAAALPGCGRVARIMPCQGALACMVGHAHQGQCSSRHCHASLAALHMCVIHVSRGRIMQSCCLPHVLLGCCVHSTPSWILVGSRTFESLRHALLQAVRATPSRPGCA